MDNLKLFAENDQQLQGPLSIVKQFSDDKLHFSMESF